MAYAFEQHESIPKGIERIALELIDYIVLQLGANANDVAIYESRKTFKQMRALLRLLESKMGKKLFRAENAFYRDLALGLAPLRDAFVIIETLEKALVGIEDAEILQAAKILRKDLKRQYKALSRELLKKGGVVEGLVCQLQAHRPTIATWDFAPKKFKALAEAVELGYQGGQKYLRLAYKKHDVENFHEWRKAVKTLWYYCRLLELSYPKKLSPYLLELKKLSDILGLANDFAVLEAYLVAHEQMALIPLIQAKQKALLASAKPLGKAIYKEDARQFSKKIQFAWKKWQAASA